MGQEVKKEGRQPIVIPDAARPYLQIQKGSLDHVKKSKWLWDNAYAESINEDYFGMEPFLPQSCNRILDIGGGMGGIDILLARHWRGTPEIMIVDGMNDPPEMKLHRETFSNAAVAEEFLTANGLTKIGFSAPSLFSRMRRKQDLIISLGAWCFHIEPKVYIDAVRRACHSSTVLILDVRSGKKEWMQELCEHFRPAAKILVRPKFDRMAFRVI